MTTQAKLAGAVLMAAALLTAAMAQSTGAEVYKAKCQGCHGADGKTATAVGKVLNVKPANDPSVKKLSEAAMIENVTNGVGKMQAFKGKLTEAQIKAAVEYFRTFTK